MKSKKYLFYFLGIIFCESIGGLAGWLIREDTKIYAENIIKPPFSPVAWLFPLAWTILYALMGISLVKIFNSPYSKSKNLGISLFFTQLFFNFFWCIIFFNFQKFGFALIWLLVLLSLVIFMIKAFKKVDKLAYLLQIPYLFWLFFATYLNFGVWYLN